MIVIALKSLEKNNLLRVDPKLFSNRAFTKMDFYEELQTCALVGASILEEYGVTYK